MGIKLVELRESGQENVNIGILEIRINSTLTRPKIVSIDLGSIIITDQDVIMAMRCGFYGSILTPDGREIPFTKYLDAYSDEVHRQDQLLKTITIDYPPVKGKLVMYSDGQPEVEKISITGFLCKTNESSNRSFNLIDQVHMIMKEIFEKNGYKLLKSGVLFGDSVEVDHLIPF